MLICVLAALLDANAIIADVTKNADAQMKVRQSHQLAYTKNLTTTNGKGKVTETKQWRGWWDADGDHQHVVRVDGLAVDEVEKDHDLDMIWLLRHRFTFTMAEPQTTSDPAKCDGRTCYVIAFEPIPGEVPVENKLTSDEQEAIVSHLTGLMYIDVERKFLVRAESHNTRAYGYSAARFRKVTVMYHQQWFDGGTPDQPEDDIPVVTDSVIHVEYAIIAIFAKTEERAYTYGDHRYTAPQPSPAP